MAEKGSGNILARDTAAIICDADIGDPTTPDFQSYSSRARVNSILHQLFNYAGGTLHHLAGSDQLRHVFGQQ